MRENEKIANDIVNAWGLNDANDPHAGDALRGRIETALDKKDANTRVDAAVPAPDAEQRAREIVQRLSDGDQPFCHCDSAFCPCWVEWGTNEVKSLLATAALSTNNLAFCACGDGFTKENPGTCVNCVATIESALSTPRPEVEAEQIVNAVMRCLQQTTDGDVYVDELRAKVLVDRILRGDPPPSDLKANARYDLETSETVLEIARGKEGK